MRDRRTHRCAYQCGESAERHCAQVVAAEKLPLQQLILFSGKRTRKSVWKARDVLTPDEMGEIGQFVQPSQFMEGPAQRNQQVDVRGRCQCRRLGSSTRHPPEDVWVAAKLRERPDVGICSAEISEEAADGSVVPPNCLRIQRGAERRDGAVEGISQRMLKRRSACALHDRFPGRGRICLATARAYSR